MRDMKKSSLIKGYLYAITSAVIYGCMPLMAKRIYAQGVNPMTLVMLRNLLAVPVLAILAYCKHRTLRIPLKSLPAVSITAFFGCCVTPVLLFSAYNFIPSGTATIFHFIYPALVVLAGILFLKRPAKAGNLIAVVFCVAGVVTFFDPTSDLNWQGSALALLSGVTFTFYVLRLSRKEYSNFSGILFTFYTSVASSVIMLIACIVSRQLLLPTSVAGWSWCGIFALAVTVGAVLLFQQGTFLIGGERTSILSTLEPITGVVIGITVLREPLTFRSVIGSVLVIAASVFIALMDAHQRKVKTNECS